MIKAQEQAFQDSLQADKEKVLVHISDEHNSLL